MEPAQQCQQQEHQQAAVLRPFHQDQLQTAAKADPSFAFSFLSFRYNPRDGSEIGTFFYSGIFLADVGSDILGPELGHTGYHWIKLEVVDLGEVVLVHPGFQGSGGNLRGHAISRTSFVSM